MGKSLSNKKIDWPVLIISGGFLLLFVIGSLINSQFVSNLVDQSFNFSIAYFGSFYQFLVLAYFFIALFLALSKYGKIRLGKKEKPELSTFKWIAIIMTTLMAGGGVFWAAAEPMYHFIDTPPYFSSQGIKSLSEAAVVPALSQSYFHWGFIAWAVNGTLGAIILMYAHYHRGAPLKPRTLLYPIFGDKLFQKNSVIGTLADAVSMIAVAAGTIGPIGFLGLQAGYAFESIFGITNNFTLHTSIIIGVVIIAAISAASGVHRGIQFLSRLNVNLTILLCIAILFLGPGMFIIDKFFGAFGTYVQNFIGLGTYRGDPVWLGSWTVFFIAWFVGYAPMMSIFVARISRGRSIRQIIMIIGVLAGTIMNFWFTIVGGSGIYYELLNSGSISKVLNESGIPAAMISITQQLPMGLIFSVLFLAATIIFVLTTTDSMSYTMAITLTGDEDPPSALRIFWALIMGVISVILVSFGEGSIGSLQSFIVVTAIPVSILMLTNLWIAPKLCRQIVAEQGITDEDVIT